MSSGHHRSPAPHHTPAELDQILQNPLVASRLNVRPVINFDYDIPYVGGYSRNARIVYVDRHFPATALRIGPRIVNVLPFLLIHETLEKALIDCLNMGYLEAHDFATLAEEREARDKEGLPRIPYENAYEPYIKADEHEKLIKIPDDLDLTPYIDSHDFELLAHLRSRMSRGGWNAAISAQGGWI